MRICKIKSVNSNLIDEFRTTLIDCTRKWMVLLCQTRGKKLMRDIFLEQDQSVNRNELSFSVGPNSGEDIMIIDAALCY